ncbi:hypothetical protein N7510_007244 [Penicillium lagena]|uniref:uncharacterized protein n=1 Tax=Penicillium lagena TaxID=94218 RepID=UPI00253F9645|nr:uncharacterized protein N7510_007244 [Penicillium lagena]KAJ5610525.1 hypothetical protein N7510_007244 [Penicillium lagena]
MTDLVHDNITQLEDFGQDARISIQTLNASNIIKISTEWAKLLDLPVPRARRFGPSTAMSELIQPLILRGDDYQTNPSASASYYGQKFASNLLIQSRTMSQDIATILGFVVADGLSRIGYAYDIDAMYYHNSTYADLTSLRFRVGAQSPQSNSTWTIDEYKQDSALYWTRFDLSVDRWGYGYAINSKTTVFGLIVLLTFGSIVVLYLAWWAFVTFRSSLSDWALVTTRWGSIGELLALAINSPQSVELNGTCAGIDDWDLWKAPICIREVEPQHLGLVVGKTQETHFRVRRGVRYGSLHPYERG